MTFTSTTSLGGVSPSLHRLAAEVRFARNSKFYGKVGEIYEAITIEKPDWLIAPEGLKISEVSFISTADGTEAFFSDSALRLTLVANADRKSYGPDDVLAFSRTCGFAMDLYASKAKPVEYLRMGYREWWFFFFDGEQQANDWLHSLDICDDSEGLANAFGRPLKSSIVRVYQDGESELRVSFSTMELPMEIEREDQLNQVQPRSLSLHQREALRKQQQRQASRVRKSKGFAVAIDLDSSQEFPSDPCDLARFILERNRTTFHKLSSAIKGKL